jgi:hypothetical protein
VAVGIPIVLAVYSLWLYFWLVHSLMIKNSLAVVHTCVVAYFPVVIF